MKKIIGIFAAMLVMLTVNMSINAATLEDLRYTIDNEEVTITGCITDAEGEMIIPEEIEGYPVRIIGKQAFWRCSKITKVVIPGGVEKLDAYAFSDCSKLKDVIISNGVVEIGVCAFDGCRELVEITIPESVTTIKSNAFENTGITSIKIPKNVSVIGGTGAIGNKCTEIIVDEDNAVFTSVDGVMYDKDKKTIVVYPRGRYDDVFTVPDTVTTINNHVFFGMDKLSILIPQSVISIGFQAFDYCTDLNIYYVGSEEDWEKIDKKFDKEDLDTATITYNYTPMKVERFDIPSSTLEKHGYEVLPETSAVGWNMSINGAGKRNAEISCDIGTEVLKWNIKNIEIEGTIKLGMFVYNIEDVTAVKDPTVKFN